MKNVFYRPENAYVGDVIPYYDKNDQKFKLFYLKKWRDYEGPDRVEGWHMLTTNDHVNYSEQPTYVVGGTGSILQVGETYHMFYCKFERQYTPVRQWVHHAISNDGMKTWIELLDEAFQADDKIYEITDLRDPFVFWNEEEQCYWMLVAAQAKGNTMRKGCVGFLKSEDLSNWQFCEPFYNPMTNTSALECPDLFKIGDWYYLIYSCYTDRFQTVYRMSRSLYGPWIAPEVDTFDTRAFYAAKSASDGTNRYLYGWNPTRYYNMWEFNPEKYMGDDYNTWDWGGSMIVHKLNQQPDGTLTVSPVDEIDACFSRPVPMEFKPLTGDWRKSESGYHIHTPYAYSSLMMNRITDKCKLEMYITYKTPVRQFGVALQIDDNFDMGYYLVFEPYRGRVQFKTGIRFFEDGGKMFPYEVEMERPLKMELNVPTKVRIYIDDSILVVYFNDQVAISTRMFNYKDRNFGLFASDGSVSFEKIRLFE
jgi:beta-fructofuranosidase